MGEPEHDGSQQAQDLVKSVSIANLLQQRDGVVARVVQALSLLAEASTLAQAAKLDLPRFTLEASGKNGELSAIDPRAIARARRQIDAHGWHYLLHESGLRTFMDSGTRRRWDAQFEELAAVPELTEGNIRSTFLALHERRDEMFEAGVILVFQKLSRGFRTNQPQMFGKRLILSHLNPRMGSSNYIDHGTCASLDDLARVFHIVDHQPEPDHRHGYYFRCSDAQRAGRSEVVDAYLRVQWFKKGTGHVTFLQPDKVAALNRILAKHFPDAVAAME